MGVARTPRKHSSKRQGTQAARNPPTTFTPHPCTGRCTLQQASARMTAAASQTAAQPSPSCCSRCHQSRGAGGGRGGHGVVWEEASATGQWDQREDRLQGKGTHEGMPGCWLQPPPPPPPRAPDKNCQR